jgi:glutamate-1-semialdehyde 2,1-aminomutase
MQAGIATLELLRYGTAYETLDARGAQLEAGMQAAAASAGLPLTVNRVGSMLTGFFVDGPVTDYASATSANTERYARYHGEMLRRGVYLAPSQFESAFVSLAHTNADLEKTATAATQAMQAIAHD